LRLQPYTFGVQCPDDNGKGGCYCMKQCPLKHRPVTSQGAQSGKRRADEVPTQEPTAAKRLRPTKPLTIPSIGALGHSQQQNSRSSSPSNRFLPPNSAQLSGSGPQGRPQGQHFQQQNSPSIGHNPFHLNGAPYYPQGYQQP
jgi:hypothetical protein